MKKLSIVVPVFNSQDSIPHFFARIHEVEQELLKRGVEIELIFTEDGSTDNSFEELKKLKAQRPSIKVLKLTRNFGAVSASKCAIQHVTGDCFIVLAVDLQDPPELLLEMIEKWEAGCKYVIAIRKNRKDPLSTKIFSWIYYRLVRMLVVKDYPMTGFDMMMMDKQILPYMQNTGKNIHRSLYAHWLGFKSETIHYDRPAREHGKSGWTFSKKLKLLIDSLLGFSILPIRVMMGIGLVAAVAGMGYGLITFIGKLYGNIPVPGYTTIIVLITFFSGLIIMMLGIIGEYLWRIFDQTNPSPEYVVDEIL